MAAKPLDPNIAADIVAMWRTGEYSQQDIANEKSVSKGVVNKLCKGVEQDTKAIVTAGIEYRQGLAGQDDRNVTVIKDVVDERMRHIEFFNSAAIRNVQEAMNLDCESQMDFRSRAETISKGRQDVLGKSPETAIQINNQPIGKVEIVVVSSRREKIANPDD